MTLTRRVLAARGTRAVADGLVASTLSVFLSLRGASPQQIGFLITATLLGSAVMTLVFGPRVRPRVLLRIGAGAMVLTGIAFAWIPWLLVLGLIAAVGPLNPSGGDVSPLLPAEQALLANAVIPEHRTAMFARYNLVAAACAAIGSSLAGLPERIGRAVDWSRLNSLRMVFVVYAAAGLLAGVLYGRPPAPDPSAPDHAHRLDQSRRIVQRLTLLFALDSAGGGLVGQSLVALWLFRRYQFSLGKIGLVFAATSLLSAASALAAPRIAARIGLVRTMVFTHLPANFLLIGAALAPSASVAVGFLLARSLLSQLDVPARQSYVMSVVRPEERAAAAAYTNVPRSLGGASTPALAGWLLGRSTFGWPLIIGGVAKAGYDLLLLAGFRNLREDAQPR